jgi:excisionase family DNA binding protein
MTEPEMSGYLTVKDIALRMRVSKMTVYRLLEAGSLPSVKFRKSFRVREKDLLDYLEAHSTT